MKHKHAEIIKAKVDDMSLSLLVKISPSDEWVKSLCDIPLRRESQYFLCRPRHIKACLHWLNGGEVECQNVYYEDLSFVCSEIKPWDESCWYMNEAIESRIKPKKEKRWIVVCPSSDYTSFMYDHRPDAEEHLRNFKKYIKNPKIIEIEIEVD